MTWATAMRPWTIFFKRILAQQPDHFYALMGKGTALLELGNMRKVWDFLIRLEKMTPITKKPWYTKAWLFIWPAGPKRPWK